MKSHLSKGKFIVFEGGEGCGKTTQINLLKDKFGDSDKVIFTREPGGTEVANQIRNIITTGDENKLLPETELALIYAARNEHVNKLILPAINSGKIVICDRFTLSTMVYQGVARGLSQSYIDNINNLFIQNLKADITLLFDLEIETTRKRTQERNIEEDERFEKFSDDFHENIRKGYLNYAKNDSTIKVIDASKDIDSIHKNICNILSFTI